MSEELQKAPKQPRPADQHAGSEPVLDEDLPAPGEPKPGDDLPKPDDQHIG
ncbi:hypothetical protein [Streptomyces sp. YIM 98790]|uniref:hypothetical protein n=1 Tax=Streptomyces sp. YIM 98790 TaxID=2689077 RepID=UPI00140E3C99|nr:hypothetical protein [Streptomyces sp. YIM 98790]